MGSSASLNHITKTHSIVRKYKNNLKNCYNNNGKFITRKLMIRVTYHRIYNPYDKPKYITNKKFQKHFNFDDITI